MAIGIDVSIYAKTELLLSPLGVRIVAYRGMCSEDAIELQSPQGARIVAIPFTILDITGQELQSPQGARIVALIRIELKEIVKVTVPARGANCSND